MLEITSFRRFVSPAMCRPSIWPLCVVALYTTMSAHISVAQAADVTQVSYQQGALTLAVSGKSSSPQVEVWPGSTEPTPSELVIITLPDFHGNPAQLQQAGNVALQTHPELKKFLVAPLNSAASAKAGLKIVLEVQMASGVSTIPPLVSKVGKSDWMVTVLPGASSHPSQTTIHSEAVPFKGTMPLQPDSPTQPNTSSPKSTTATASNPAHPTSISAPVACPNPSAASADTLQLTQALDASNRQREALQQKLAQYEELIREYAPETLKPGERDAATIQNLRSALLKLATKLKATELALSAQTTRTRALENRLSAEKAGSTAVTHEPASLHLQVAEPTPPVQRVYSAPDKPEPAKPNTLAIASTASAQPLTPSETVSQLEDIIRENPRKYPVYIELATLYQARGDRTGAENILNLLLRQNPAYSMGYYHLAMLYAGAGRNPDAQTALDAYQRLRPDDQKAIQAIRQAMRNAASPTSSPHNQPEQKVVGNPTP